MAEALDDRSKDLVVDVIVLALSRCTQGGIGLAFRSKLRGSDKVFAEDAIDMRPIWTMLAATTGIDLESSKPAFRYVSSLSKRLGIKVVIPDHIDPSEEPETPLVKTEELDRFFAAASAKAAGERSLPGLNRKATPLPAMRSSPPIAAGESPSPVRTPTPAPTTTPTPTPLPVRHPTPTATARTRTPRGNAAVERTPSKGLKLTPPRKQAEVTPVKLAVAIGALVAAIACIWFIARPAVSGRREWKTIPAGEISTDIPIAQVRVFGHEAHLDLADSSWLQLPEETRIAQLKTALQLANTRDLTIVVVKEGGRVRATAQWYGSPPTQRVRFY